MIAVLGKKAEDIVAAQEEIWQTLPFDQKGIDSDNGDKFINWRMDGYCHDHHNQKALEPFCGRISAGWRVDHEDQSGSLLFESRLSHLQHFFGFLNCNS